MKSLKEHLNGIVLCLFELVVGVLLLISPVSFTVGIIKIAGVVLIIIGLVEIVKYFRVGADEAVLGQTLSRGLISLLAGVFCVWKTGWFIATFPVLTMLYGVMILLAGVSKIQMAVDMLRHKNKKWFWSVISAAVSIICAVVILKNPFTSTAVLWIFTGASMIVEGALDVVTMIMGSRTSEGKAA